MAVPPSDIHTPAKGPRKKPCASSVVLTCSWLPFAANGSVHPCREAFLIHPPLQEYIQWPTSIIILGVPSTSSLAFPASLSAQQLSSAIIPNVPSSFGAPRNLSSIVIPGVPCSVILEAHLHHPYIPKSKSTWKSLCPITGEDFRQV